MVEQYIIDSITFIQFGSLNIPYYAFMIVKGPKGGMYIVDEFNTEIILKKHFRWTTMPYSTSNIMREIGNRQNNIRLMKFNEEQAEHFNTEQFIQKSMKNHLIRRNGIARAKMIGDNILINT